MGYSVKTNAASQWAIEPVLFRQMPRNVGRQRKLMVMAVLLQSAAVAVVAHLAPFEAKSFIRNHPSDWITLYKEPESDLARKSTALVVKKPTITLGREEPVIAPPIVVANLPVVKPEIPSKELPKPVLATAATTEAAPQKFVPVTAAVAKEVQTGGFGDENGPPPLAVGKGPQISTVVGSFDASPGLGTGNGSAGTIGRQGFVERAGFGGGIAERPSAAGTTAAALLSSGFDSPTSMPTRTVRDHVEEMLPVHVTFKPSPVYTDEARALKIEGDVVLEVVFEATGTIRVLRVVRGLGHGLDESAQRAAEKIQFSPAKRAGVPTDYRAVLHVSFRLA